MYWWGVHLLSWKCFVLRSFWVTYWSLTVTMQPFFNFLTFFHHDWLHFTCQQQKSISAAKSSVDLAHTFDMRYHLMSESRFYGHIDHFSDWSWCPLCISRTQAKNAGSNWVLCISSDNSIDVLTNTFEIKYHLFSESWFCGHSVHFSDWS